MKIDNNQNYQNFKADYTRQRNCPDFGNKSSESTKNESDKLSSSYEEFCKKWFTPRNAYSIHGTASLGSIVIMIFALFIVGAITLFRKHKILGFK